MRRDIFIGDVHGCLEELDELLERLAPAAGDRLFFVGDLVDRGPDSVGAIRRVRELLEAHPGSAVVMGNHEEKVLRFRERNRPLPEWGADATDADWAFLDEMPLFVRVPECAALMVHGGIFPRFFEAHGELGELATSWRKDRGKRAERLRRFLRVRQVNDRGDMVHLDDTARAADHWSDLYDGREGFAFYGHDPQLDPPEPRRSPHALGLDTGCCFGGRLTAAIVAEGSTPRDAELVSVAARAQYAEPRRVHEE